MRQDHRLLASFCLGGQERAHVDHPPTLRRPRIIFERDLGDPSGDGVGVLGSGLYVGFVRCPEKGDSFQKAGLGIPGGLFGRVPPCSERGEERRGDSSGRSDLGLDDLAGWYAIVSIDVTVGASRVHGGGRVGRDDGFATGRDVGRLGRLRRGRVVGVLEDRHDRT